MLAVDWSGDAGAVTKPAATTYFALAVVAYEEKELSAILAQLRSDQRLPEHFEYHFAQGPSKTDRVRHDFMRAINHVDLRAAILSGSKTALSLSKHHQGLAFLTASICDLLTELPRDRTAGVSLVIDGTKGETKQLCERIMSRIKAWPERPNRPRGMGSHQCDGIQLADMLAGAARHKVSDKTPDYLEPLMAKVILKEAK